jgi:phage FluMu protein Com
VKTFRFTDADGNVISFTLQRSRCDDSIDAALINGVHLPRVKCGKCGNHLVIVADRTVVSLGKMRTVRCKACDKITGHVTEWGDK